jgi:inhibitor of KinA
MSGVFSHTIYPVSDSALTIDFGNVLSGDINQFVLSLYQQLTQFPVTGMIEVVPAYSSVTIYYDLFALRRIVPSALGVYEWICLQLGQRLIDAVPVNTIPTRKISIPVCYEEEYAPNIANIAKANGITREELIHLHTSREYRVYMLGFLPGFPYMGELDNRLVVPRKPRPQQVEAGSVGIAGQQTGIYPLASPGGWSIIGKTPLLLFDSSREEPVLMKAGDTVIFYSISSHEFKNY